MVNQSLQFLEYFCFTVDYSLHLLHTGMLNKKNLAFLKTPLGVPSQVYKNALKIAGSIISHFCSCKQYNYQLFQETRVWSQARHLEGPWKYTLEE